MLLLPVVREEAKAKADGKTLGDKGYDPTKKPAKIPCAIARPEATPPLLAPHFLLRPGACNDGCCTPASNAGNFVVTVKNDLASIAAASGTQRQE